jgi:hypothetical protein
MRVPGYPVSKFRTERRRCLAPASKVWATVCLALLIAPTASTAERQTAIGIADGRWQINQHVTYPGAPAEGLLMNVRMVNAVFEDTGPHAARLPEGFSPDANTEAFIQRIPEYAEHGIRAFTLGLQGGRPSYTGNINSAFESDGALRSGYLDRVRRVIEACDRHGVAVILTCFYQSQHSHPQALAGRAAARTAVGNVARWLRDEAFTNVLLEIANEPHVSGFRQWRDSAWLQSDEGQVELIRLARDAHPGLLIATGGTGTGRVRDAVAEASDFILVHFNNTPLDQIQSRIETLRRFGKPVVCNEDDKIGEEGARAAALSVGHGASWGFMHKDKNQFVPFEYDGAQDDPAVYAALKRVTTPPPP